VGLGDVSPKVPQDVLDQVDDIKQQILDGSLQIPDKVG
jgi:basic membrane lipoprotein Med (substrate-binding protein (PBP1-ABC) superfamily)